ncbi:MAG: cupin domain-containing protein [Pyrinomonadaceae bacterium]
MADQNAETVLVRGNQAPRGEQGEHLLVNGERMAMRLWTHEKVGVTSPEHSNTYEYVAYVVSGRLRVKLNGHSFEAGKGDSYCVPADSKYSLEILEEAMVVEATSPSDRGANTLPEK